ncbi:hypothetical protein J6590_045173 [Homalodisca vitripennis]|nr:hypothetical protein J6590_045173 [Homalodisca vitripennis]
MPTFLSCVRWHYDDACSSYHMYDSAPKTHEVPTMCTLALRGLMQCLLCARWHYGDSCSAYHVYAGTPGIQAVSTICTLALPGLV